MTIKHRWAVVVNGNQVSVLGKHGTDEGFFSWLRTVTRHGMNVENAGRYLEEALAQDKFDALMLVGKPDDVRHFRGTLKEQLKKRVMAEVIRPNHDPKQLDERIEEMCA